MNTMTVNCLVCGIPGRSNKPGVHKSCVDAYRIMLVNQWEEHMMIEATQDLEQDFDTEDTGVWDLNELWPEEEIVTQIKVNPMRAME